MDDDIPENPHHAAGTERQPPVPARRDFLRGTGALAACAASAAAAAGAASSAAAANATAPARKAPPNKVIEGGDWSEAWRKAPVLPLWPDGVPDAQHFQPQALPPDWSEGAHRNIGQPDLRVFRPARPDGRAVLSIPGGAYQFVSVANEGVEVARRLNAAGVTVFVLRYRLPNEGWIARSDVALHDAQRAVRLIRARAQEFAIDGERLVALGFSAGGHLAATLSTDRSVESTYAPVDDIDRVDPMPHATGLIYPVVTMDASLAHGLSRELLLGPVPLPQRVQRRSPEQHVDAHTPPQFLVHSLDDATVPVANSLLLLQAMRAARRPVEAHFFQEGGHGYGTGAGTPGLPAAQWPDLFLAWLRRLA